MSNTCDGFDVVELCFCRFPKLFLALNARNAPGGENCVKRSVVLSVCVDRPSQKNVDLQKGRLPAKQARMSFSQLPIYTNDKWLVTCKLKQLIQRFFETFFRTIKQYGK